MKTSITDDKSNIPSKLAATQLDDYKPDEPDESKLRNSRWAEMAALSLNNIAPDNTEVTLDFEVTDKGASVSGSWA